MNQQMNDHVYKQVEIVGSSPEGVEAAVTNALSRAAETIRQLSWFEVVSIRGGLSEGSVREWQVTLKVAFTLE